jgi:hypothetical protein
MDAIELTSDNFMLYALKQYDNSCCTGMKEFLDDLNRFKYIKRLLRRYEKTGKISERLVLNHLILLHNVFHGALLPMLFFQFDEKYWPQIKTFLVFLSYLPDGYQVNEDVFEADIPLDQTIIQKLRRI